MTTSSSSAAGAAAKGEPPASGRGQANAGSGGASPLTPAQQVTTANALPIPPIRSNKMKPKFAHMLLAYSVLAVWLAINYYCMSLHPRVHWCAYVTLGWLALYPIAPVFSRMVFPGFDDLDQSKLKKNLWVNTFLSCFHSCCATVLVVASIVTAWPHFADLTTVMTENHLPFFTVAFSTGYFMYDLWDYLQSGLFIKSPAIIMHHVVVTACFYLGLVQDLGVLYLVLTLLCEANSIFLHLRSMLAMAGFTLRDHYYRLVWRLQWATNYTSRIMVHSALCVAMVLDIPKWNIYWWSAGMTGLVLFNILNSQLFLNLKRVHKKDREALKSGKHE